MAPWPVRPRRPEDHPAKRPHRRDPEAEIVRPILPTARPAEIRYLGFRIREEGREYALRARNQAFEARLFLLLIPHAAFTARWASYQDGPDVCFQRLRSELAADPDLQPRERWILSQEDLDEYREAHLPPSARRRRRARPSAGQPGPAE